GRIIPSRVVDQDLGSGVPVDGQKLQVNAAAAFPEKDAEGINSSVRHNDIEGRIRVVQRISILAARRIAETEHCPQRIPRIRSGTRSEERRVGKEWRWSRVGHVYWEKRKV